MLLAELWLESKAREPRREQRKRRGEAKRRIFPGLGFAGDECGSLHNIFADDAHHAPEQEYCQYSSGKSSVIVIWNYLLARRLNPFASPGCTRIGHRQLRSRNVAPLLDVLIVCSIAFSDIGASMDAARQSAAGVRRNRSWTRFAGVCIQELRRTTTLGTGLISKGSCSALQRLSTPMRVGWMTT